MNVLIEFEKTAFCWCWQITEHDLYSFFYSHSSLVLCRVSFFSHPMKQHTPTTWVRQTKILSSSDMLQAQKNPKPAVAIEPRPHYFCLSPAHTFFQSYSNQWKDGDGCSSEVGQGNSKCQPHTHRMSNTHSSPWCGGTNKHSWLLPCVWEGEPMSRSSVWSEELIKTHTGTHCPKPGRVCYPRNSGFTHHVSTTCYKRKCSDVLAKHWYCKIPGTYMSYGLSASL